VSLGTDLALTPQRDVHENVFQKAFDTINARFFAGQQAGQAAA
jgi:hypothetical protein